MLRRILTILRSEMWTTLFQSEFLPTHYESIQALRDYVDWNSVSVTLILLDQIQRDIERYDNDDDDDDDDRALRWHEWHKLANFVTHNYHIRHALMPLSFFRTQEELCREFHKCNEFYLMFDENVPRDMLLKWICVHTLRGETVLQSDRNQRHRRVNDRVNDRTRKELKALIADMKTRCVDCWCLGDGGGGNDGDTHEYALHRVERNASKFEIFGLTDHSMLRDSSYREYAHAIVRLARDYYIVDVLMLRGGGTSCAEKMNYLDECLSTDALCDTVTEATRNFGDIDVANETLRRQCYWVPFFASETW